MFCDRFSRRIDRRRGMVFVLTIVSLMLPARAAVVHGQIDPPRIQRIKEAIRGIGLEPQPSGYSAAGGLLNFDVVAGPGGEPKSGEMRSSLGVCANDTRDLLLERLSAAGYKNILAGPSDLDLGAGQKGIVTAKPATWRQSWLRLFPPIKSASRLHFRRRGSKTRM
jgi:hypothetical protein